MVALRRELPHMLTELDDRAGFPHLRQLLYAPSRTSRASGYLREAFKISRKGAKARRRIGPLRGEGEGTTWRTPIY